ncbi:hypothetical protein KIM372_14710 [Bombiscardovia nodaiensis]|uniref:Uncharacterized protein n=1 Tax=Bombiscardovia nodaiensis TaxID=2932181 RepID=A0ABM8B9I6_9BIFI|nr:hypothetical protein KIM372_14710 [Bombiscardovia nodaiensis]
MLALMQAIYLSVEDTAHEVSVENADQSQRIKARKRKLEGKEAEEVSVEPGVA